ncbi:MAG TPA: biotin/lipoyl-containing protein [Dehalococcoidia bacterium]|nr:biotin/lipoyl-containing protein [Dehalococcoidia bacterium]
MEELNSTVRVTQDGRETALILHSQGTQEGWCRTSDSRSHGFASSWVGSALHLWLDGNLYIFERVERTPGSTRQPLHIGGDVLAPMPGTVMQILVEVGSVVEPGDRLIIMESMKMELVIDAPRGGVVRGISVSPGSLVDKGMRLLVLEAPAQDG